MTLAKTMDGADARPGDRGAAAQATSPRGQLTGRELAVAAVLAVGSFLLYIPSLSNSFVAYDDGQYVTENKVVQRGITGEGVVWAFTTTRFANWLPVTWLSHMLDCHLFGLNAAGHHATSALLHAFNAVLLFFALREMTGRFWEPVAVAALFAVHQLRVESVSWVAERKDVLCATFFFLALIAYTAYSRRPTVWRYLVVVLCHALGLMSKTMLVTLPCVLLLLDYWPLRRLRIGTGVDVAASGEMAPQFPPRPTWWLVVEKLPLLALSVVSSAWTIVFQSTGGAMFGHRDLTLAQRVANAVVSVPRYLVKFAWPADLSVFYPHPGSWPAAKVASAVALVLLVSVAAVAVWRRRPYVTVGWILFLGMLVPVSGVIQVGLQSMADRYMYLPSIGLLIAGVWWLGDVLRERPRLAPVVVVATAAILVALSVATWRQQRHWQNTFVLFQKALAADPDNWLAHNMLGTIYAANAERAYDRGDPQQGRRLHEVALVHERKSLDENPGHYLSHHNYAWSLHRLGRYDESIEHFRRSIEIYPTFGYSHLYLAATQAKVDRMDEAFRNFEEAARLLPNNADTQFHWAEGLLKAGRTEEAVRHLRRTLELDPNHGGAKYWLERATAPTAAPATAPSTAPATVSTGTAPATAPGQ
jgi:Flp pilus assembly protein TadD